ncbi:uncharacterized protein LOC108742223 isoform X2 [Agrilus planipennis]|uniref:Uncharacterized protein LOC108742223 isoform X2 n=1 Tax=Agrilus planipennis TaxID=224129 RepID=A0A1W4X9M3_AGRPL|nr:uncharacterized protein LOC108742223 isoform X2 [Agrilus planipennis]
MSLVADYESSGSSSSSESEEDSYKILGKSTEENCSIKPPLEKLPKPAFNGSPENNDGTSVFKNPFKEEEQAKTAILEKHVKMVNLQDNVKTINGKKICWNYRKGRCRFGHNCKYAHDSDIQKSQEESSKEKEFQQSIICEAKQLPQPTLEELGVIQSEAASSNKKKRSGLCQGLVPNKKVMKMYYQTKK